MNKKIMSLSAVALMVLLGSCSKNEVNPESQFGDNSNPNRIAFRSSTTKANDNGLTELQGGFHVIGLDKTSAYLGGFGDPKDGSEAVADDQWNVFYKYNDPTANKWDWKNVTTTWGDAKLWPTTDVYPLTFFAAYPATTDIKLGATTFAPEVVKNMTPNAGFIYNTYYEGASNAIDMTKVSVDYLGALASVPGKPVSGFADLTFKHIMSNVQFEIQIPTGYKVIVQSIKIANLNYKGRTYDYKTAAWTAETAYTTAEHAHFAHLNADAATPVVELTSTGIVPGNGDNSLKLMPQTAVTPWALGEKVNPAANTFLADAKAWSAAHPTVDAAAIEAWYKNTVAASGMKDSEGWKGARIELTYRLIDNNGKDVVGYSPKAADAGAGTAEVKESFVRVGYVLDLANLKFKDKDGNDHTGFVAGYKYKFQIQLGSADATNGTLLDPDFKDEDGGATDKPIDNPATVPGEDITKGGKIQFNVTVDEWVDATGVIK